MIFTIDLDALPLPYKASTFILLIFSILCTVSNMSSVLIGTEKILAVIILPNCLSPKLMTGSKSMMPQQIHLMCYPA